MSCNATRIDLNHLVEPFRTDITTVLHNDPANWIITEGYRDNATQDAYFAKGRDADGNIIDKSQVITNARGGESPHNYGLAADFYPLVDGKQNYDYENGAEWQRLYAVIDAHPRLHSLRHMGDGDHAEAVHWRTLIPKQEAS